MVVVASALSHENIHLKFNQIREEDGLPPSACTIYKIVLERGPVTSAEICKECDLAPRTVRHGLKLLVRAGHIEKLPHLLDMRSSKFYVE